MFTNPGSEGEGPWTGSDTSEGTEGQSDWADTVNSVLNKTKESVTTVNKQIQDTWKQVGHNTPVICIHGPYGTRE